MRSPIDPALHMALKSSLLLQSNSELFAHSVQAIIYRIQYSMGLYRRAFLWTVEAML